jgi:hypothetical protein
VILLFSFRTSAIAVAPASPMLFTFECWWENSRKRKKIFTVKVEMSDAFVFFQSISNRNSSCTANIVPF